MATVQTIRAACTHDCQDACALLVTVENGRATSVGPNPDHPVTGQHLCVKVDRYLERVYSPSRVLTPLRRDGAKGSGRFVPIGWDEALDTIVARWRTIIDTHGAEAILPYSYLGNMGILSAFGTMHALFHRLGASRLERTICGGQHLGLIALAGVTWMDPERLADSRLVVAWGIDLVSTSVHTWDLVSRGMKRGARLVVVDPYRSRTAQRAHRHLRVRPGTDGALALAMMHVILAEKLEDADYLARHTTGIDELRRHVADWTPARAAESTGLEVDAIVEFAREYATTRPAAIRPGVGMQRAAGSGMALRALHCLAALTGQWRDPAGGVADARSIRAADIGRLMRPDLGPPARTLSMIQLGRHLTDLTPPIKALYVWNSNPAVIAPDQQRTLAGLAREDLFTVVHDQFLTDTARWADLVLPATTMLEQDELVGSWGFNYLARSQRSIAPLGESKTNTDVARLLAARLGFDEDVFALDDRALIGHALQGSRAEREGASLDRLEREAFVRVGPQPGTTFGADGQFPTPSGKFEFASEPLAAGGFGALPAWIPPAESPETQPELAARFPLRLLTLKRHHSINSSYGALPVLARAEPEPAIELAPGDAVARRIADGDIVRVFNERGTVTARARISDRVLEGTIAVPFGHWMRDGASANALTSDRFGDLGHGPTVCDALVEVSAIS